MKITAITECPKCGKSFQGYGSKSYCACVKEHINNYIKIRVAWKCCGSEDGEKYFADWGHWRHAVGYLRLCPALYKREVYRAAEVASCLLSTT